MRRSGRREAFGVEKKLIASGTITALLALTVACESPATVKDENLITIELSELNVVVHRTGLSESRLLEIRGIPRSEEKKIQEHERIRVNIKTSAGDREAARIGPYICEDATGQFLCDRFIVSMQTDYDVRTLRDRVRRLNAVLWLPTICSVEGQCEVVTDRWASVVVFDRNLRSAMDHVASWPEVRSVELNRVGSLKLIGERSATNIFASFVWIQPGDAIPNDGVLQVGNFKAAPIVQASYFPGVGDTKLQTSIKLQR